MPTAPEIAPTEAWANARSRRSALRSASKAKPASLSPNDVGSAWTPWVRPTQSVPACSRARSASAAAKARAPGSDDVARAAELQPERGVEHVGGGQPEVDPAPRRARRGAEHVDEGGHVMIGDLLALLDGRDGERGRADRLQVGVAGAVELLGGGHLDVAPGGHPGLVGPDGADLGAGVAVDHGTENESGHRVFRSRET